MQKSSTFLLLLLAALCSACAALNVLPSKKISSIQFEEAATNEAYQFIYQNAENSPELETLSAQYTLDEVAKVGKDELGQILQLLAWTNSRWEHSGSNQPSASNTLTILKEAETGMKFRCVEYGIVLRSVLASQGFIARTLGLKTQDVEKVRIGAGHVLTEAWSDRHQKWFLLDAQFNLVPTQNGIPLNAVEFQQAIIENANFKLIDANGEVDEVRREKYLNFIPHYLYFFDFKFDQREMPYDSLYKVNDKGLLMLVPLNVPNPTVFQRKSKLDYLEYTHSLGDFYRKPE